MNKLSIVILNYNTKDLTLRAVASCLDLSFKDIHIFLVDNASSDGSKQLFAQEFAKEKRVTLLSLDENIGFAGGNNVALKKTVSEYVMLLNSDAYFPKGSDVASVLDFLDAYKDIGMLTPFVELSNGQIDPACHRGFPTPWNAVSYFSKLEELTTRIPIVNRIFGGYHQTWKDLSQIHPVDACSGAAVVLRTAAIEEVGVLDERFFMYGEDLDWCYRFKQLEWKVLFYPFLKVIHDKHSSGLKKEKQRENREHIAIGRNTKQAFYDAMKLFYKKHNMGPAWTENVILLGIHLLSKVK